NILLERAAGARDPRFGVDDEIAGLDEAGFHQGKETDKDRGRIAAGASDQPRLADGVAIMLGQSVDRFTLELERPMRAAIPFLVNGGDAPPEIARHIDNL